MKTLFHNKSLYIATKHGKEEVISPVFESYFNMKCFTPENFDSDVLGTFTGEIERNIPPVDAAREKCRMVAQTCNADLIIASEGSFGPHPLIGFVPVDEEILLLTDLRNNLEIKVVQRSTKTNFASQEVSTIKELFDFAEKAGFPSHGLILKSKNKGKDKYVKGIVDNITLINCFHALKKRNNTITVETDMRAMYNPTRMQVIQQAAEKLAQRIKSCCPKCSTPGFGIEQSIAGLKCSQCSLPTKSTSAYIYRCLKCDYEKKVKTDSRSEDPTYCDFCNP